MIPRVLNGDSITKIKASFTKELQPRTTFEKIKYKTLEQV